MFNKVDLLMNIKISQLGDRFWIFSSLISFGILYLNLIWKTTGSIDRLTTDSLFWMAIIFLVWRKKDRLNYQSDAISSFLGFLLIGIILFKLISLFWFESIVISLTPICFAISLVLLASGIRDLWKYWQELFFAWFLFFPTEALGRFIDHFFKLTVLTAKFSTYFLYYLGFNVANQSREVVLFLPDMGSFTAIVNYSCSGITMILLMLKLALLLISFTQFSKIQSIIIPLLSIALGFILGVVRVCILTLTIPNTARFNYWHGDNGAQIFSTIGVIIFAAFCYWMLQQQELEQQLASKITSLSNLDGKNLSH